LDSIKAVLTEPSGLVLVTGPTGSGKSTLLNGMMQYLNDGQTSIVTIENPVEYYIEGELVKQIQVTPVLTFARALRSALRLDPDKILVGEIRDQETMETAIQAAQTGHLVLATLHSNNCVETISRAIDLMPDKQRDAFRLAEVLKAVFAQRLMSRYGAEGETQERHLMPYETEWLNFNDVPHGDAITESPSNQKMGRFAVIEAMMVDSEMRKLILGNDLNNEKIYARAILQPQYESLIMAGVRMAERGRIRLNDCRAQLESYPFAAQHKSLRRLLCEKFGLGLQAVADLIDAHHSYKLNGGTESLESYVQTNA
jgi:type II secretory ATPase GspE/PulE/Tfp pilus assembly ATPase PilB-like protein